MGSALKGAARVLSTMGLCDDIIKTSIKVGKFELERQKIEDKKRRKEKTGRCERP
jgi:hypothetical protein